MKSITGETKIPFMFFILLTFGLVLMPAFNSASTQDKLKPEELVAKHLASIGAADSLAKITSRVAGGVSNFVYRVGGTANLTGTAMIVSSGAKLRFGMQFRMPEYPGEDVAFDGNKAAAGFLPQGRRSALSLFLTQEPMPLKEGLIGGVLSTAWPFLRMEQSQPKLEYRGLKKIDGRQLHELGYRPRKGSTDLKTLLYFDPVTFHHVRTRYQYEIAATIATREAPSSNPESYVTLTEDFDDFRTVEGLTLPHKYRLQHSSEGRGATTLQDWTVIFNSIKHNDKLDDQLFTIK